MAMVGAGDTKPKHYKTEPSCRFLAVPAKVNLNSQGLFLGNSD